VGFKTGGVGAAGLEVDGLGCAEVCGVDSAWGEQDDDDAGAADGGVSDEGGAGECLIGVNGGRGLAKERSGEKGLSPRPKPPAEANRGLERNPGLGDAGRASGLEA